MGNIGIIGRARVGKDTAGKWLVDNRGYRRVALADPLKEAALALDPIVAFDWHDDRACPLSDVRLSEIVARDGWEVAKERDEVRRILQHLGAAMRAVDPEIWLRAALAKTQEANEQGVPVAVTDVRYPNEAASLRRAGFHLLHISRPDVAQLVHESEGALTAEDADYEYDNAGSVEQLHEWMEVFSDEIYRIESARHFARL
ncbi:hypothetical protein [Streptomyces sp. NPDC058272]|uniref:deoxynucleotide monophosphate kinase family protein n=1 Tax=Streptomyces sp. NPDC058272 TaxID=3346415 RepID=UPI0036E86DF8